MEKEEAKELNLDDVKEVSGGAGDDFVCPKCGCTGYMAYMEGRTLVQKCLRCDYARRYEN